MQTPPTIRRVVVRGWTYWWGQMDNTKEAHTVLSQALASSEWPAGRATFTVTPGGFVRTLLPADYDGGRGWGSVEGDLAKIIPYAQAAVGTVVSGKVLQTLRERTKYLTIGVDLNREKQKEERIAEGHRCRIKCPSSHTHAELVALFDTDAGEVIHWTGKSYPVDSQQHTLVHVVDLDTHLYNPYEYPLNAS